MGITLEEIEMNAALPINPTIIRIMRVLRIARGECGREEGGVPYRATKPPPNAGPTASAILWALPEKQAPFDWPGASKHRRSPWSVCSFFNVTSPLLSSTEAAENGHWYAGPAGHSGPSSSPGKATSPIGRKTLSHGQCPLARGHDGTLASPSRSGWNAV